MAGAMSCVVAVSFGQNLLVDPCFETSSNPLASLSTIVGGLPGTAGVWGVEAADIAYGLQGDGVTPFEGNAMLRAWDDGLTYSQIWQFVDVTSYAAIIDAGLAVATASAHFNAHLPVPPGPADLFLAVHYSTDPNGTWGTYSQVLNSGLIGLDNDPMTWQQVQLSGVLPVGTRYVLFELAFRDEPLRMPGAVLYGYADCTSFEIVPEPAMAASLVPGLLLFWRRRSRK